MRSLCAVGLGLALLLPAGVATAQEAVTGTDGQQYQRKTVINFEDDTIEGDLKSPDGEYLEAKKRSRHKSLIRIREEFRRRILQSAGSL